MDAMDTQAAGTETNPPDDEQIEESHPANHAQLICNDLGEEPAPDPWVAL